MVILKPSKWHETVSRLVHPQEARLTYSSAKRVDRIKSWLSSEEYRSVYEQTVRDRHGNSGLWFLSMPEYQKWKNAPFCEAIADTPNVWKANWHERILFVQGATY